RPPPRAALLRSCRAKPEGRTSDSHLTPSSQLRQRVANRGDIGRVKSGPLLGSLTRAFARLALTRHKRRRSRVRADLGPGPAMTNSLLPLPAKRVLPAS